MKTNYRHSPRVHNTNAAEIIVPIILKHIPCNSVLDVGCGTGTWLTVFRKHQVFDILGVDGHYVNQSELLIDESFYLPHDLNEPFDFGRRFDLVVCLEVAEHLDASGSYSFIRNLCHHSDNVLFSSAVPGQGGQNHINEQWPSYWEEKFRIEGFSRIDIIRPEIWNNSQVDIWYRQNTFLYSRDRSLSERYRDRFVSAEIHPELWDMKIKLLQKLSEEVNSFDKGGAGIMRSFTALFNAIKNKLQ